MLALHDGGASSVARQQRYASLSNVNTYDGSCLSIKCEADHQKQQIFDFYYSTSAIYH